MSLPCGYLCCCQLRVTFFLSEYWVRRVRFRTYQESYRGVRARLMRSWGLEFQYSMPFCADNAISVGWCAARAQLERGGTVVLRDRERFLTLECHVAFSRHAGRCAVASPPDRWGKPQTGVSGRPACGCGSRTSRGEFLAILSGTSPRAARCQNFSRLDRSPPSACDDDTPQLAPVAGCPRTR